MYEPLIRSNKNLKRKVRNMRNAIRGLQVCVTRQQNELMCKKLAEIRHEKETKYLVEQNENLQAQVKRLEYELKTRQ